MSNFKNPRHRTIKDCLCEIRKLDPETAITEWFIRQLCKQGKVEYFLSGNKSLVNLSSLLRYLGFSETNQPDNESNFKEI